MITPEQFVEKVKVRIEKGEEPEGRHHLTDDLMEEVLIELGYGEGVRLIRATDRWYS
jgi:hypothetical protein